MCLFFIVFGFRQTQPHAFNKLYKGTKQTLPTNRIIVTSEESDDDMVGSSDSKIDISIENDSARVESVEESFISEEGKENK